MVFLLYTKKWLPLQGERAALTKTKTINNEPILICFMQAAGMVQDMFAGEAGEGEKGKEEMTGGFFYRYFDHSG